MTDPEKTPFTTPRSSDNLGIGEMADGSIRVYTAEEYARATADRNAEEAALDGVDDEDDDSPDDLDEIDEEVADA